MTSHPSWLCSICSHQVWHFKPFQSISNSFSNALFEPVNASQFCKREMKDQQMKQELIEFLLHQDAVGRCEHPLLTDECPSTDVTVHSIEVQADLPGPRPSRGVLTTHYPRVQRRRSTIWRCTDNQLWVPFTGKVTLIHVFICSCIYSKSKIPTEHCPRIYINKSVCGTYERWLTLCLCPCRKEIRKKVSSHKSYICMPQCVFNYTTQQSLPVEVLMVWICVTTDTRWHTSSSCSFSLLLRRVMGCTYSAAQKNHILLF